MMDEIIVTTVNLNLDAEQEARLAGLLSYLLNPEDEM